jgi:hypothetical protein
MIWLINARQNLKIQKPGEFFWAIRHLSDMDPFI